MHPPPHLPAMTTTAPMLLLRNAEVYAPEALGLRQLLLGGGRVLWMGEAAPALPAALGIEVVDLEGARLIPGLIDGHVHASGGGEAGSVRAFSATSSHRLASARSPATSLDQARAVARTGRRPTRSSGSPVIHRSR